MARPDRLTFIIFGGVARFPPDKDGGETTPAYFEPYAFSAFLGALLLWLIIPFLWLLLPDLFNLAMTPVQAFTSRTIPDQYAVLLIFGLLSTLEAITGLGNFFSISFPQPVSLTWRLILGLIGLLGYGLMIFLLISAVRICRNNDKTWQRYKALILSNNPEIKYGRILPNLLSK